MPNNQPPNATSIALPNLFINSSNPPTRPSPKDSDIEIDVAFLSRAVHAAACQNCQKCMIGDVYLNSIIIRSLLKNATPDVLTLVMAEHSVEILDVATDEFLDLALQRRLETIDANKLVDFLAKAGRLGFDEMDVFNDAGDVALAPKGAPKAKGSDVGVSLVPKPLVGRSVSRSSPVVQRGPRKRKENTSDTLGGQSVRDVRAAKKRKGRGDEVLKPHVESKAPVGVIQKQRESLQARAGVVSPSAMKQWVKSFGSGEQGKDNSTEVVVIPDSSSGSEKGI